MVNNQILWKSIAQSLKINVPDGASVQHLQNAVRTRVEPINFGKYCYLQYSAEGDPLLHTTSSILLPVFLIGQILKEIPGKALLSLPVGMGNVMHYFKDASGNIRQELDDPYNPEPAEFKDAKRIEVISDITPPSIDTINGWQSKVNGLFITHGSPYICVIKPPNKETKSFLQKSFGKVSGTCFYPHRKLKCLHV